MAKYNFTAIMSLQLVAMVTIIACAAASMEEVSSSKYGKWAEQNKMTEHVMKLSSSPEQIKSPSSESAEEKHNKESCAAPSSSENDKAKTNFRPRWSAEEMENMNDNQLREVAASLMAEKDVPPIAFHNHPKHNCWQKCAFEKVRPYCEKLVVQASIQGCLLAGGKACALYCTGGSLK